MPFFVCGIELFIAVLDSFVIRLRTAVISVGNVRDNILSLGMLVENQSDCRYVINV